MAQNEKKYPETKFNVVLVYPQIPNNTGNIGRTCVATHSHLHLIEPLGFEISDKRVKRAGLDYWDDLEISIHKSFEDWYSKIPDTNRVFFFSARAEKSLFDLELEKGDWLVFGEEATGLSPELKERFQEQLVKIPFRGKVRSFNLANAVAMGLGEGMRQLG